MDVLFLGGDKRDRTADLLNAIQALSQLSYTPICSCIPLGTKIIIADGGGFVKRVSKNIWKRIRSAAHGVKGVLHIPDGPVHEAADLPLIGLGPHPDAGAGGDPHGHAGPEVTAAHGRSSFR